MQRNHEQSRAAAVRVLFWTYRRTIGPAIHFLSVILIGPGSGCRYQPTCSEYARDAILADGWIRGSVLALKRLSKCHPFTEEATHGP